MIHRKDIDGLRAVAVIPVILFHSGFDTFSGGLLGVDVFFVISGYLITTLILEQKITGTFSVWRFYERRARRILPALLLVMSACVLPALALMLPDDLENFGQSLVATTLFSNNILLWLTSDYFQLEAEFKPLLHTWTLGVEEQYFIIYPALLSLIWFTRDKGMTVILTVLAVASLLLAEWGWRNSPEASFYLLPTRGWELLAGALAALYLLRAEPYFATKHWPSLVGLGMIIYSFFALDANTPTPSLYTGIPVLGTALVIMFSKPNTLSGRILAAPGLVGIGLISYSLYLWHQPLLAFMRITRLEEPGFIAIALCLGGTLILSLLSYRYVEVPFRSETSISNRALIISCSTTSVLLLGIGLLFHFSSGLVKDWPELVDAQGENQLSAGLNKHYNKSAQRFYAERFPDNGRKNILILGGSFARDFINMGIENNYFDDKNVVYNDGYICQFESDNPGDQAILPLIKAAHSVVFASRFSSAHTVCLPSLAAHFKMTPAPQVLIVGQKNFGWNNNAVMLINLEKRYTTHVRMLRNVSQANEAMHAAASQYPGIGFLDIMSVVADKNGKVPVFTPDHRFISQDRQHLTKAGAQYLGQEILKTPQIKALVTNQYGR